MLQQILDIRNKVNSPLIHCIMPPVSANDCANIVLAAGGKPIMAEHINEMEYIVKAASCVSLSLGCITPYREELILKAVKLANEMNKPCILDAVGISCSEYRLECIKELLLDSAFSAIKGNIAEISALADVKKSAVGLDAKEDDDISKSIEMLKSLAKRYECVVFASGSTDIVASDSKVALIKNGKKEMSLVSGTGCMLTSLCGVYMSVSNPFDACCCGASVMGIAGEIADPSKGMATYKINLLDKVYILTDFEIEQKLNIALM